MAHAQESESLYLRGCGFEGSGFLATGVPGIEGTALITAAHVAAGCDQIEVWRVNCQTPGSPDEDPYILVLQGTDQVRYFADLDVVAFGVTLEGKIHALQAHPDLPTQGEKLVIHGSDKMSTCTWSSGPLKGISTAKVQIDHVVSRTRYRREDFGGLGDETLLLQMQDAGVHGNSGGAVVDSQGRLIGMYQGGAEKSKTTWAVLLDSSKMGSSTLVQLKKIRKRTHLLTSGAEAIDGNATGLSLGIRPRAFMEFDDSNAKGAGLEGFVFAPLIPSYRWALGLLGALGGSYGETDLLYRGPTGGTIVDRGEANLFDVHGTLAVAVRFFQQSSLGLDAELGYSLGSRFVLGSNASNQVQHGPTAALSLCGVPWEYVSLCVAPGVGYLNRASEEFRIVLGNADAEQGPDVWVWRGSLGMTVKVTLDRGL